MYTLPSSLTEDIQYFGTLIDEFKSGKLEPVKFKAIRVPMGIYEQRKDGTFMVRIRCAGGYISPKQLKETALIAQKYHSSLLHVTTRQELQIQNLHLSDTLLVLQDLKKIGLASKGGGGNTVRNIMASVDAGLSTKEVFDVYPYSVGLTNKLIAEPDSFTLPRKFKIAFSGSEEDEGYARFNDLGFIARIKDGQKGFGVFLGGSLGSKPMIGYELFEFIPEKDLFYVADAAKKLFSRYGNRKNKHKARLRYVFYKLGKEEVFRLFMEIYHEVKKLPELIYTHKEIIFAQPVYSLVQKFEEGIKFEKWKQRFVQSQRQADVYTIIVPLEHGNIDSEKLIRIADFAANFGEDVIRFSMRQNLHLRNIPGKYLSNVFHFLSQIDIPVDEPLLLNNLVACTGADTCRLGICFSKGATAALRKALSASDLNLERLSELKINISGCPNSCGQQVAADLGFYGKVSRNNRMYPAYHIVAGARTGKDARLAELAGEISARDLPAFTIDLLQRYLNSGYHAFSAYIDTEGIKDINEISHQYNKRIPDFSIDKNYYYDWGGDALFSLVNKGMGECSAGLFDMIDVDLKQIHENTRQLETTNDKAVVNDLLFRIIYASSRMLLITRGSEPKNATEVFHAFIEKFIDSKFVPVKYKEIVEKARDHKDSDFTADKNSILELSQAVITLYEKMDDSLQFTLDAAPDLEVKKENVQQIRRKDFRGVACPMNFVKTKIELSTLQSGDILEILLDDGAPIDNVPGSVRNEGHKVLEEKKTEDHWTVIIQKT